ncbi:MAG: Gfo/Idh/MocA family oxidoreductase [Pseudomonadota bacterium]
MIKVGLVGYGYWGPNLARNFAAQPDCELVAICESQSSRIALAKAHFPGVRAVEDFQVLLDDPKINAILIATPVSSHFSLAKQALQAGKDVLVEKPMTETVAQAEELIALAKLSNRILAVDHTFLFTGAVQKMKEIVSSGQLGEILYMDSVRINLGLFQQDVNVISDLAPHDLSIMNYLIDKDPIAVKAMGVCHAGNALENVAYLHVEFPNDLIAHFHLNWLAPVKIRRTLIGGSKKMIVYDDMEASEKVKIYDSGITIKEGDIDAIHKVNVDYRTGDMIAPKLPHREALSVEAAHFLTCVRERSKPLSDGIAGLRVIQVLEAAKLSIKDGGSRVLLSKGSE